jgi:rod shape-determining protein MreD
MSLGVYLVIPLMVIVALIQVTILPLIPIFGVVPQLWLVATIAWSLLRGLQEGFVWALVGGILIDVLSASPLGSTTLALMAAVIVTVFIQNNLPQNRTIIPMLLTMLGTIVYWFIYLMILRIVTPLMIRNMDFLGIEDLDRGAIAPGLIRDISSGYGLTTPVIRYVLTLVVIHGLLGLLFYYGFSTLERLLKPRRVEI